MQSVFVRPGGTFPGSRLGSGHSSSRNGLLSTGKANHSTWKDKDTRVKEQSVKFPHDYKMQNYTKIEKIDRFLMCIKTNKQKKTPKSPECNTEPLGSASIPAPQPQSLTSLQGTGEFLMFFLNILAGPSLLLTL